MGNVVVVLVMHGTPPNDIPGHEIAEFFGLHGRLEYASGPERVQLERRYSEIEAKIRAWPRTVNNDPFYWASQALAEALGKETGYEVILGFNEFCNPGLDDALERAVQRGAEKVIVITPMMTSGGEHSEIDIPRAIEQAKARQPGVPIVYAWPFQVREVAQFLASNIARYANENGSSTGHTAQD